MKKYFALIVLLSFILISTKSFSNDIYEITVYHFKDAQQEITLDTYLQTALLPALHREEKKVGVFKPIANDTSADKIIYMIVSYKSLDEIQALQKSLMSDAIYNEAGKTYLTASYQNPPYTRMEKIILTAFETSATMNLPQLKSDKKDHVYELRSYESPTENYHINKVKMFNAGEIDIFNKLNFNAVFYGDVIAGSHMPNLMYLTCFENMADRDEHWKKFTDDANTKTMFAMDEYKNNVSKADITLMHAASYSDY